MGTYDALLSALRDAGSAGKPHALRGMVLEVTLIKSSAAGA
jgi:hypothetical protein